jgi:hypothetical protein
VSFQGLLAHFGAPGARRGARGAPPARPSRLVSGTSTSMGGFPCWGCGWGSQNGKIWTITLSWCALSSAVSTPRRPNWSESFSRAQWVYTKGPSRLSHRLGAIHGGAREVNGAAVLVPDPPGHARPGYALGNKSVSLARLFAGEAARAPAPLQAASGRSPWALGAIAALGNISRQALAPNILLRSRSSSSRSSTRSCGPLSPRPVVEARGHWADF